MGRNKWMLAVATIFLMVATTLLPVNAQAEKVLYVGGTDKNSKHKILTSHSNFNALQCIIFVSIYGSDVIK